MRVRPRFLKRSLVTNVKLYKYRPLNEYTEEVIFNSRIYFPTIDRLNDPCELIHPLEFKTDIWDAEFQEANRALDAATRCASLQIGEDISKKEARWRLKNPQSPFPSDPRFPRRDACEELYNEFELHEALRLYVITRAEDCATGHMTIQDAVRDINAKLKALGILSLTECPDSQLMFAHYAAEHTGIVLEFESDNDPILSTARPMEYVTSRPRISAKNVVSAIYMKSADWTYEREHRVLQRKGNAVYSFTPHALTGVIFGCRVLSERIDAIAHRLGDTGREISLYQAVSDPGSFSLKVRTL